MYTHLMDDDEKNIPSIAEGSKMYEYFYCDFLLIIR